nr:HigA family addiction module antitoxin [Agilicoccus flavus]
MAEAAARLGVSRVTLSRVLRGHARISPNLAIRLEEAGAGTARAWTAMQTAHDLAQESRRDAQGSGGSTRSDSRRDPTCPYPAPAVTYDEIRSVPARWSTW